MECINVLVTESTYWKYPQIFRFILDKQFELIIETKNFLLTICWTMLTVNANLAYVIILRLIQISFLYLLGDQASYWPKR